MKISNFDFDGPIRNLLGVFISQNKVVIVNFTLWRKIQKSKIHDSIPSFLANFNTDSVLQNISNGV